MILKNSKFIGGVLLLIFIAAYSYYQNRNVSYEYYAKDFLLREKQVLAYLKLGEALAESDRLDDLPKLFGDAISVQLIDWYQLSFEGSPVFFSPAEMRNFDLPQEDGAFQVTENYSFQTVDLGEGYFLTVGVNRDPEWYASHLLQKYWDVLTQDILVVTGFTLFLLSFFMRDLLKTFQSFRQKKGRRRKGMTAEAAIIEKSMSSLYSGIQSMDYERELLRSQVLPSLRREIFSGKVPPYEFDCVLMRTDINGFSEMFLSDQKDKLMDEVLRVFTEFSVMASRYQGLIHEFIGDEVIVYFKEEDHENAVASALALLRDFHEFLSESSFLKVKSSLSRGSLYFSKHVQGYNLSGAVLIESVRLLSLAQKNRVRHQVLCSKEVFQRIPQWAQFSLLREERLKGFSETQEVYFLQSFQSSSVSDMVMSQFHHHRDPVKHLQEAFLSDSPLRDLLKIRRYWTMKVAEKMSLPVFRRALELCHLRSSDFSSRMWLQFILRFDLNERQVQLLKEALHQRFAPQSLYPIRNDFFDAGIDFDFKQPKLSFRARLARTELSSRKELSEETFEFYRRSLGSSSRLNRVLMSSFERLILYWKKTNPGELLDFRKEQEELERLFSQAPGARFFKRYQRVARPSTSIIKSLAS